MKKISIMLLMIVFVLTGCGNTSPGNTTTDVQEGNVIKNEDGTITINHLKGSETLDATPTNVASLSTTYTESMVALGVIPTGATTEEQNSTEFPSYVRDDLENANTVSLGWQTTPDIEAVVALQPDLILITPSIDEYYSDLSKIAPTIEWEFNGKGTKTWDWRVLLQDISIIFDKEDEAQKIIEDYDNRVEDFNNVISEKMPEETVMYLRVMENELRYYGIGKQGFLYDELTFKAPKDLPNAERSFEVISIEKLLEINPDHIFLLSDQPEYLDNILKSNKLYKDLNAVKENHVYPIDYTVWQLGFGPLSANLRLDDINEALGLNI